MTTPSPPPPASTTVSRVPDSPSVSSGVVPSGLAASGVPDATSLPAPAVVTWGVPDAVQTQTLEATPTTTDANGARPTATKPRAGRRPGAVWGYFTPVRTEQNKTHAVCRFCARRCAGVAARMATHLLTKCPAVPAQERDALTAALAQDGGATASSPLPPPEKRQRVDNSSTGLAGFGTPTVVVSDKNKDDGALLVSALQLIAVACLRVRAPLLLVEDAFFRDALALLRPCALATIQSANAATLRESVHDAVTRDAAHWMRASESFTLVYNSTTSEWRGADSQRRCVLIAEASPAAWRAELETHLQLVGDDTIVGLCCDARDVYDELVMVGQSLNGRIKLVSKCLLVETARLWTLAVEAVPQLTSVVSCSTEIAQTHASSMQDPSLAAATGIELTSLNPPLSESGWSLPFRVVRRVDAVAHSLQLLETEANKPPMAAAARASFWKDLGAVDALLAPFVWLFALSESKSVSASQIVLGWLWLLATIARCPLLAVDDHQEEQQHKPLLVHTLLTAVTHALEDHHLVALLLDPRIRGAGLSATGRRKVKTLVAHVATRLWPAKYEPHETAASPPARQALLMQLAHYMDKTGCFADDVVWEMASGAAPESFWRDYAQDAPELTELALAVLTHAPVASQTSELLEQAAAASSREPLDARQIRFHFERNRKNGVFEMASVLNAHAELLTSASSAVVSPPLAPTQATAVTLSLAEAVGTQLQRLRAVGEAAMAVTPLQASHSSALRDTDTNAVDATWFVFQSETSEQEIAAALRRMLPASMATTAPPPAAARRPAPVALAV